MPSDLHLPLFPWHLNRSASGMNLPALLRLAAAAMALASLAGCNRATPPPATPPPVNASAADPIPPAPATEQTTNAVSNYTQNPTAANQAQVDAAFTRLDDQIHQLQDRADRQSGPRKADTQAQIDALKQRRDDLRHQYDQAKFDRLQADTSSLLDQAGQSIQTGANAVGDAAKATGNTIKNTVNGNAD